MPQRKTYGKKTHNAFFSPGFSWSSPRKISTSESSSDPGLAKKLHDLSISQTLNKPIDAQEKRALRTKDSNARKVAIPIGAYEDEAGESHGPKGHAIRLLKAEEHVVFGAPTSRDAEENVFNEQPLMTVETSVKTCRDSIAKFESAIESDSLTEHAQPLLNLCSDPAARSAPTLFSTWSSDLDQHFDIAKIAEASYGEVYRLSLKTDVPGFSKADESVMKLIALKPPMESDRNSKKDEVQVTKPNTRRPHKVSEQHDTSWMSSIDAVVSEVQLLRRMTTIPGFTNFREIRILRGRPGKPFVAAWKAYNKAQRRGQKSIYPDPSKKSSYTDNQLWAVIEMQDAGTDLERVCLRQVWCVWDVFWGVAIAIAKGEENAQFEHRDLHLGNVCVRSTRDEDVANPSVSQTTGKLGFTGLEATIIDYTLSRADMNAANRCEPNSETSGLSCTKKGNREDVAYLDLALEPEIFNGDAAVDYQYEVYRYMRSLFFYSDPLTEYSSEQPARSWRDYCPGTNVVWLHFVLHTLLSALNSSGSLAGDLSHLDQGECTKMATKKAAQLRRRLQRLNEALDFRIERNRDNERFESASEIVEWAVEVGWLDEADVLEVSWRPSR